MLLLGLNRRLADESLSEEERQLLLAEIKTLEAKMGL
jgi:hypothetical protein